MRLLSALITCARAQVFERTYAAGRWLQCAATTRTIDMNRTSDIHVEKVKVLSSPLYVACGVAKTSKAQRRIAMRPLHWRAPLVPVGEGDIDLYPLLDQLSECGLGHGCIFRDFNVPEGCPHTLANAISWRSCGASHARIVACTRELLDDDDVSGHDARHVIPEVARVLEISQAKRTALGHWRESKPIAESKDDRAAFRRAVDLARRARTRAGNLSAMADRYSSVCAEKVVADTTRTICLLAVREQLARWGDLVPDNASDQVAEIHSSFFADAEGADEGDTPRHTAAIVLQQIADGHSAREAAAAIQAAGGADAVAEAPAADDAEAAEPAVGGDGDDEETGPQHGVPVVEEAPTGGTPVGVLISRIALNPAQADLALVNDYLADRAGGVLGVSPEAHATIMSSLETAHTFAVGRAFPAPGE